MGVAGLGTKRECHKCGAKFFDMGADPVVCPKCGTVQKIAAKPKAAIKRAEPAKIKKPIKPKRLIDDEDDAIEALDDGAELEDLEDLDDSPEVISLEEVEEHQEEAEVDPNSDDAEDGMFVEENEADNLLLDSLDSEEEHDEEDELHDEDEDDDDDDDKPRKRRNSKR